MAEDDITAFTITYTKPGEIITLPRETITLPLFIKNNTSKTRECLSEIIFPEGWKVVFSPLPFALGPNESRVALATIFVPRSATAGIHHVTYKIIDKNQPTVTDFLMLPIRVLPSYHIVVEHIDAPKYVIAGSTISSTFTVMNQGNTSAQVDLQIYSMNKLPYTVFPLGEIRTFTISPTESRELTITVETDVNMKDVLEYRLEIKVRVHVDDGVDIGDDHVVDRAASKTNIIPRISGVAGLYHLLPVMVGIKGESYFNDTFGAGSKISVKSEGSIDENHVHNIKVRIEKAINTTDNLLVNPEDFYFFRYWNSVFDIFLGDYTYYLSPLTERYTSGRGAGGSVFLGPFSMGTYYHRDLSSTWDASSGTTREGVDHVAGYVDFLIPELTYPEGFRYKVALNIYSTLEENLVLAVRQQYRPFQYLNFDLEVASGLDFSEEYPLGYAVYFDSAGAYKWLSYKMNGVYADPFFPGAYKDLYIMMGSLGFHFLENRLKFNTTYQQQQRNISLNESFLNTYIERNALLNCFYSFGQDLTSFTVGWKYQNRVDQSPEPQYLYHDNGIHMTLFQPINKFALNIGGEFRYLFNDLDENDSYHHKYQSSLDYAPDNKQVYSFSLAYNGDYFSDRTDYHRLSVSANYNYALQDLKLDAEIENIYAIQDWNIRYFSLGISCGLTYTLLLDQTLSLNTAYTISSTEGFIGHDAFLILEYKVPFSIPISKKMSIGSLHGTIIDETSGEGVKDVIVYLGGYATVTDVNGEFSFNAVKPGIHYINLDRSGIKKNYIPTTRLPMEIEIEKGKKTEVEISVIEGATVRGQVFIFKDNKNQGFLNKADSKESSDSQELSGSGFPFILIELSNGQDVMRRLSDKHGQFSFDEVLPGKWTLKVVSNNYPEYHTLEQDSFDLDVTRGDLIEIEFRILPEKRLISFLNTTDTLFIRPPDEDMIYELEWQNDPTPEPESETTPGPVVDKELTPEPTPEAEAAAESTPEPTPEPESETTPEPVIDKELTPEPTPEAEAAAESTPEPTPEPESETTPEPAIDKELTPEPTHEAEAAAESTPEPTHEAEAVTESTPEPTPLLTPVSSDNPTPQVTGVLTPEPGEVVTQTSAPQSTDVRIVEPTEAPTAVPTQVPGASPTPVITPERTQPPLKTPVPTPGVTADNLFDEVPPPVETLDPEEIPSPTEPGGSGNSSLFNEIPPPKETLEP